MIWWKWRWWRLAKELGSSGGFGRWLTDGQGVWWSILGTRYMWLRYPGKRYCSECQSFYDTPKDPYQSVCENCK